MVHDYVVFVHESIDVCSCMVDKPSNQDEEVPVPNPVSILTTKTMDFVRRNSYGDLSMYMFVNIYSTLLEIISAQSL